MSPLIWIAILVVLGLLIFTLWALCAIAARDDERMGRK